jgi:spermidine synthase
LRAYAVLELGICVAGLLLLFGMPLAGGVYPAWAGTGAFGMVLRGIIAGVCLLPPTFLMGATLPLVSRWVEAAPQGVSWIGFLYGANIFGAVFGSLLTGFYLLRLYDIATATYVAVALNVIVALLSVALASAAPHVPAAQEHVSASKPAPGAAAIYIVTAISGTTALAAEVVWTRLFSLLFGATVYTFALILAVFLLGLGIGANAGAALARKTKQSTLALGCCQLLLCAAIAWTAHVSVDSLPYWPMSAHTALDPWLRMGFDLLRCLYAALPPAMLWGASFPLALAAVARPGQEEVDPGLWVGRLYGANTVGGIVGSLATSLLLVAWIGSRHTQQALIAASAISALLVLAPLAREQGAPAKASFAAATVLALVGVGLLAWRVPQVPADLIAYGLHANAGGHAKILYSGEGLTASIAVSRENDGTLNYHSAGKIQASTAFQDMRLQRILGHMTTLVAANPRRFLVIGLGAGVTAGAVSIEPRLDRETIVDIEPIVPRSATPFFRDYNFDVLHNPRVQIRADDGRHYLLTTRETFDGITSDPFDPWVKGVAALYTKEFFELARQHLNPGGVVTQFVQLYYSDEAAVKSEIASFFEAFPNGLVFANTVESQGYDIVLVGQAQPSPINADDIQSRLRTPAYARVANSLQQMGFFSGADLLATYVGQAADFRPWLKDAIINRDSNLRVQYLAGLNLDAHNEIEIYQHMTAFGPHFSPNVFTGSASLIEYLRQAIEMGSSR